MLSDGSYLVERFRTRFVLSGRELVYQQPERVAVGSPVIFADPDFDLTPGASEATLGGPTFKVRSASGMTFAKLDSSAAEAASVKPSVEGYTRSEARMLLDDAALESEFKNLHRPRILMLSTHGFFQPPPENHSTGSTVGNRESVVFDNPLLRCGLALAGCNKGLESADENTDDGILTGLEIVGTDLRGTELVVLSACETGLGDVKVGEGLAGLRHAFQLAGAQSVVSSLWQVEDNETARLMSLFFSNLAKGMNKSEALRQAQMERITVRRERNGAAHPFFWAAFTLTGN